MNDQRYIFTAAYRQRVAISLRRDAWHPYETAPRDGSPLLVKFKDNTIVNAAFLVPGFPFLSLLPWDIYGHRLGSQYEDEKPLWFRPFVDEAPSTDQS
jgi:hypothetical protein